MVPILEFYNYYYLVSLGLFSGGKVIDLNCPGSSYKVTKGEY